MGELFHRLYKFSIRGCLELLNRTARAIAGHLKEDLGGCIRQANTHPLEKTVSWALFFRIVPIEGSLFL